MNVWTRRKLLSAVSAAAVATALLATPVAAESDVEMVTVVKQLGNFWFNLMDQGQAEAGEKYGVTTSIAGPSLPDPAQQVRIIEDLIARKVDVIGLVPSDVNVLVPVLERAAQAGIPVITQEGQDQEGRTWDVELTETVAFGERMMQGLAQAMGEEGDYIAMVGSLTTPLPNAWADAAIAYQKAHYPKMRLVTDRFAGGDVVDTAAQVTRDVLQTYPELKGMIGFTSDAPIGMGNVIRERGLEDKVAVIGMVVPSQGKALLESGAVDEGFLWSPRDAGYAMSVVAAKVANGEPIEDGFEVEGLGAAKVDKDNKLISFDKIVVVNPETVDALIEQGL